MNKSYAHPYFTNQEELITTFEDGSMNAAYTAVDRNIELGNGNKSAYIFEESNGKITEVSFFSLAKKSNKIANYLSNNCHIQKGDRVFLFLPRIPELYYSFIGILKTGAIAGTLFSAFQEQALKDRLFDAEAKVLFTTKELLPRIKNVHSELPKLEHIIVVDEETFQNQFELESEHFSTIHTDREDFAFMLYTSGTTGKPKGIVHSHFALIQQIASAKLCLDLRPEDIYWCTADPGWVTGIVYSILSNLSLGITTVIYNGKFDTETWYKIIEKHKVTVWYTAPTAIRMLMSKGDEIINNYTLSSLRHLASVGEPLNPEAIVWGKKVFGLFFHDGWWQTETGSIMIANTPLFGIHPGSMGKPLPWVDAAIIDDEGNEVASGEEGNLCIKPYWPSIMRTVWNNTDIYNKYFKDGWYFSGDKARKDEKGYFWFIGRTDDIIKTSGERIGPFEVESALVENQYVIEAGVIGKPDELRGEIIKAFVVLKPEIEPTEALKIELQEYVKHHLAGHAYPREIEFIDVLPKTRSGKIMRRVLKAKELGLPVGDISTLEDF